MVTFSSTFGGNIFGASSQAVDYCSSARSGVVIAPDSGYVFTGWKHDAYTSLRGQAIPAAEGIMHYDTLNIMGDVRLTAEFLPSDMVFPPIDGPTGDTSAVSPTDRIWSSGSKLYVETVSSGSTIRIFNLSGALERVLTAVSPGLTACSLQTGIYVVTINNKVGTKVAIGK
jgi:hypothetical protein